MVTLKTLKASEEDFTKQQVTSCSHCPCFIPTVVVLLVSWATNFRGCLRGSSHPILSILHTVTPTLCIHEPPRWSSPFPPVVRGYAAELCLFFIFQSQREKVASGVSQRPSNAKGSDYIEIHALC